MNTLLRRLYETLGKEEMKEMIKILNAPGCMDTWILLLENPMALWRATDIAKELGISDATAYRAVRELKIAGLIKVQGTVQQMAGGPPTQLYRINLEVYLKSLAEELRKIKKIVDNPIVGYEERKLILIKEIVDKLMEENKI